MASTAIRDTEHWLALRAIHLGASESPSLFGCGFRTKFTLWHLKRGDLPPEDFSDNVRVICGQHLEDGIARILADIHGWEFGKQIRKTRRYIISDRVPYLGASLDYEVRLDGDDWVPLETKLVDYLIFRDEWIKDGALSSTRVLTNVEPPPNYDIQVQHQLAVTGAPHGYIGALVGGHTPYLIRRPRHDGVIAAIEREAMAFKLSLDENREPPLVDPDDLDAVKALYASASPREVADLTGDNELPEMLDAYLAAKQVTDAATAARDLLKAQIQHKLGEATTAFANGFRLSWPAITIPEKMVPAKVEPERKYRGGLTVTPLKSREAA